MPGKQYIFILTLFQSILNIWNIPGSAIDLVLDNSLHYFWFTLDLLMVLLVCFLVAKLSDTNFISIKKGETATTYVLKPTFFWCFETQLSAWSLWSKDCFVPSLCTH